MEISLEDKMRSMIFDWSEFESQTGCLIWRGKQDHNGYARIYYKGETTRVSRLSIMLFKGPIPDGMLALHTCDNTSCVNPNHLYVGTHHDNNMDCVKRGRHKRGNKAKPAQFHKGRTNAEKAKGCANGHLWTPENLYMAPKGTRQCRICNSNWLINKKKKLKELQR